MPVVVLSNAAAAADAAIALVGGFDSAEVAEHCHLLGSVGPGAPVAHEQHSEILGVGDVLLVLVEPGQVAAALVASFLVPSCTGSPWAAPAASNEVHRPFGPRAADCTRQTWAADSETAHFLACTVVELGSTFGEPYVPAAAGLRSHSSDLFADAGSS